MDDFDTWIYENCKCKTCVFAAEYDLFRGVLCNCPEHEGGMGWLGADSLCECHDFSDPALASELERRQEVWYAVEFGNV